MGSNCFKHPSDTHGGFDKGETAQRIVVKFLESHGVRCEKTSRQQDVLGIDYIITYKNQKRKIAVNSTWNPTVSKKYCRFCYGGHLNTKIPGCKNSPVDLFFHYNVSHSDSIFYMTKQNLLRYIDKEYGEHLKNNKFSGSVEDAMLRNLPQLRHKDTTNLYDIWILVPIDKMRSFVRPNNNFDGMFK